MIASTPVHSASSRSAVRSTKLFVVFVCTALIVVTVWLASRGRDEAIRDAINSNTNLNRAIAQQMDSMFSETARILDAIAFDMERADKDPNTPVRLQPILVTQAAGTDHVHSLMILDSRGEQVVSSEASLSPLSGSEDTEDFFFHRDNLSLLRHIGKPYRSSAGSTWVIPVSRRLNDSMGQFAGVVVSTIKVDYVVQLLASYEIGQRGVLGLLLADGTVLARRPYAEADIGKSTAGTPMFEQVQNNFSGHDENISPVDGVERYVSFQHLKNNPLFVVVGLAKQEVLQHWRSTVLFQSAWILILCIFVGLLGDRVIRSVGKRLEVEHRLRITRDDLTEANRQLTHLARYDGLTELANRRFFDEHLANEFAQCARTGRPLGLIMIDVDHFKLYNDTYGHPEGDKCLQAVAQAITAAVRRPHDFVARYGGEEFAVLLSETDAAGACEVAETIRLAVAMLDLPFAASPIGHVSVSAGFASHMSPEPKANALSLLNDADQALYRAKHSGRNRVLASA